MARCQRAPFLPQVLAPNHSPPLVDAYTPLLPASHPHVVAVFVLVGLDMILNRLKSRFAVLPPEYVACKFDCLFLRGVRSVHTRGYILLVRWILNRVAVRELKEE